MIEVIEIEKASECQDILIIGAEDSCDNRTQIDGIDWISRIFLIGHRKREKEDEKGFSVLGS